ncbi:uncharacterized protein L3040_003059 [Drepanopeziza brunnea f. sp. 'multigermtubi']|uniref:uncharacterized protein n=1 Tax=Drepanopeziza brunnea f. sp. 'multigermtubi' TaxID=698441 RepID=UPI00239BDF53|nr:hypothetical protein L3040_003059 [Drepanopeziza brunnea f. sp. 'multigermtubi']
MDPPSEEPATPKKHTRNASSGRGALPRRPTRGPLEVADSPISSPARPSIKSTPPPNLRQQQSSQLSTTASQHATPRVPSPGPGSNLTASFVTARTSLSPSRPGSRSKDTSNMSTTSPAIQKDFSFLVRPEIYHPLTLLDVPPPFRAASSEIDPSTSLASLLSSGHFRNAAIKAAQLLTAPGLDVKDHAAIFSLVYTRLSCLTLCNQTPLAAQEVKALEDLNSGYYRDDLTGAHMVPWELRVLAVRLQGMGFNDARRGVMGYYDLAREARSMLNKLKRKRRKEEIGDDAARAELEGIKVWEARLEELGVRVASALVEMEDLEGAARFLGTLKPETGTRLEIQKALLWLCIGDVEAARKCVLGKGDGHEQKVILALAHMADSDFAAAVETWRALIASDAAEDDGGEKAMWMQNLGVCYLYLGRMDEARTLLESLISGAQDLHAFHFHALTFNLCTIYELCTERSRGLKIALAERVAGMQQQQGDGGGSNGGWEKVNGDFKL